MEHAHAITLRSTLRPGDIDAVVRMHGTVYAQEHGFDSTFAVYVSGPLTQFERHATQRERLWLAERNSDIVGCVAIVAATARTAQLRWFLVEPSARGRGLGTRLLQEAIAFAKECDYDSIVLWTVSALTAAARLYRAAGFEKVGEIPGRRWGVDIAEERYELHWKDSCR